MSTWAARAKSRFSKTCPPPTPKTPETPEPPLLGVLGVPIPPVCEKQHGGFGSFGGFGGTPPAHSGKAAPPAIDQKDLAHDRLLDIAMRFCDAIRASDKARADWRRDVLETPPHLRQGLYNYLREQLRQPHLLWRTT